MRITHNTLFDGLRRHLMTNTERLLQAQEVVATQKRINRLSDDPLDGGRVLRSVLWGLGGNFRAATRWAARIGRLVAYGFILIGVGQMFLGSFLNGLWTAFIGWFLSNAAESSYQQVVLRDTLSGVTARDVMAQQCVTVPRDTGVESLVNDHVLGMGHRCFFVAENGDLEGLITLHNLKAVPPNRRGQMTARQVMTPVTSVFSARPDEDVLTLLRRMDEAKVNQVPVIDHGQLLGVVTRENLLHYIRLRSELGI
jgi:CBS domain-containing protein